MQCCDDSSYSTPCREVWCIKRPGQQILNAWENTDRCKRIGGILGNANSKTACCDASCGTCGVSAATSTCGADPKTNRPDPARAALCCLDQIIDKVTTNETTGVVTSYPNKACGEPPCVLGTDLVFPTGQQALDGIGSSIVDYANSKCHITTRSNLHKILGNLKINEFQAPPGWAVTNIQKHGDAVYIVSNKVSVLKTPTAGSILAEVQKVHYRTGQQMWPATLKLQKFIVGGPVRARGHFFVASIDGWIAKYTDPEYELNVSPQKQPQAVWAGVDDQWKHVTGLEQKQVTVVRAPSVHKDDVCQNDPVYMQQSVNCSFWEWNVTSSQKQELDTTELLLADEIGKQPAWRQMVLNGGATPPCTSEAASKCCVCGRGEYLAINLVDHVALMDAGDGSSLDVAPAEVSTYTKGAYFKVPPGTYTQVKARCAAAVPGATLAIINSASENSLVVAACKLGKVLEPKCFIGLHRPAPAGSGIATFPHEWDNYEEGSGYQNWKTGNLAGKPAAVIQPSDGKWEVGNMCFSGGIWPCNDLFSNLLFLAVH